MQLSDARETHVHGGLPRAGCVGLPQNGFSRREFLEFLVILLTGSAASLCAPAASAASAMPLASIPQAAVHPAVDQAPVEWIGGY